MNLQTQLLELYKVALENSRPFDDGLDMPYSNMTLTKKWLPFELFQNAYR